MNCSCTYKELIKVLPVRSIKHYAKCIRRSMGYYSNECLDHIKDCKDTLCQCECHTDPMFKII
jgi:hypothetical protein